MVLVVISLTELEDWI